MVVCGNLVFCVAKYTSVIWFRFGIKKLESTVYLIKRDETRDKRTEVIPVGRCAAIGKCRHGVMIEDRTDRCSRI
jgi:hypothetical protein